MIKAILGFIAGAVLFGGMTASTALGPTGTPDICSALGMAGNATTVCRNATVSGYDQWAYDGTVVNPADHVSHDYCWQISSNPTHAAFWCPDGSFVIVL